ncbi:hypothetical protein FE257_007416 [Aspergillus nanangensis]|uniref:Uncharacterized protein n=1 Tax=Aspergillus nanangensis TaxID=2582783 RepID=A0AAD4CPH2_ASPNN|nr:hypothetical protein FE257_007416 [Aspergillus nanangensis]
MSPVAGRHRAHFVEQILLAYEFTGCLFAAPFKTDWRLIPWPKITYQVKKSEAKRERHSNDRCPLTGHDDETDSETQREASPSSKSAMRIIWMSLTVANIVLLGIHILLFFSWNGQASSARNMALRRLSYWCPENDDAWEEYEHIRAHIVTREEILKLGKDPDRIARFDDAYWGFGEDAYMVQLDVMHQIHCLNMLSQAAFADYPGYTPRMADPHNRMWWIHLGHCTDILLQHLQCHANMEVLTLAWLEEYNRPWPDFSIQVECRDFEAIRAWDGRGSVDRRKFGSMPVPKDAFRWPNPVRGATSELGHELGQHHKQEGGLFNDTRGGGPSGISQAERG